MQHSEYYEAITQEATKLEEKLASLRADLASGQITAREAADSRVAALQMHLDKCQQLRAAHLPE